MDKMVSFLDALLSEIDTLPRDGHREAVRVILQTLRPLIVSLGEKAEADAPAIDKKPGRVNG